MKPLKIAVTGVGKIKVQAEKGGIHSKGFPESFEDT